MSRLATAHHSHYLPWMLSFNIFYLKKNNIWKGLSPGLNSIFLTLLDASQTLADIRLQYSPTSLFVYTQYLYSDVYCLTHQLCWGDRTAWKRSCSHSGARSVYVEDQSRTSVL